MKPTITPDVGTKPTDALPLVGTIQLTKWVAPYPVTKHLALSAQGQLEKVSTASQLYAGDIERLDVTPDSFRTLLTQLGPNDCLSYGLPVDEAAVRVLSRKRFASQGQPQGTLTRTADRMHWPHGPAILMVDYDPQGAIHGKQELLDILYSVCPSFEGTAHIWWPSTSSCLYHSETGAEIRGVAGQRIYIVVANGRDIQRAGLTLLKRLWLAGHGYIKLSTAGSMLVRTVADGAVWQANRIDYCAPPICDHPLESRKCPPELLGDPLCVLDTEQALRDLTTDEERCYEEKVSRAKSAKREEAEQVRAEYVQGRITKLVESGASREVAEKTVHSAIEQSVLHTDFALQSSHGETVTVRDLLHDPTRWHGATFADPLEPDYHGDHRVARAYLLGVGYPYIHSFAHGGRRYRLARQIETIRTAKGERARYLDQVTKALSRDEHAFLRGQSLVEIGDRGDLHLLTDLDILKRLDHTFRFERMERQTWVAIDASLDWARQIAGPYAREFKPLKAVLTAPTICPKSGRILSAPGYHPEHQVFVTKVENFCDVPGNPTQQDVADALRAVWSPVRQFPFGAPIDQSVMLAALFLRRSAKMLSTSPAVAFTAPVQSSGKSLLIKLLCALAGATPTMSPPTDSRNDEELRKRLFACVREGSSVIVIDNIIGAFDSPSLASLITSEHYKDRVLGESRTDAVPNNTQVLLSGNNLTLQGDLPRRVLICRIDPEMELPHQRAFDFDPEQLVTAFRQELVAAVLTILRAYMIRSDPVRIGKGRLGSFEGWDDMVRQPVCWLAQLQQTGKIPGAGGSDREFPDLIDPMEAINEVVKHDPFLERHGRLLRELAMGFGTGNAKGNLFSTRDLMRATDFLSRSQHDVPRDGFDKGNLHDLLVEVAGDPVQEKINSRSLGRYFAKHRDRIVEGLCLRDGGTRQNVALWYVEAVSGELCGFGGLVSTTAGEQTITKSTAKRMPRQPTKPTKASERQQMAANEPIARRRATLAS